jgi:cytochrome oxidase Cu insertion factor (SCO1/SenC/PrrC family)
MRKALLWCCGLVVVLFFLVGVWRLSLNLKRGEPTASSLAIGTAAPDIEAEDVDGKTFKLSDYRGKVVLLDFWGHW